MAKTTWISASEAAKRVGVDSGTIRRWCIGEKLDCQKISNFAWIIDEKSLPDSE